MVQAQVIRLNVKGKTLNLAYTDPNHVRWVKKQRALLEPAMLEKIRSLGATGTILEVGANTGNHVVFYGMFCGFEHIVAIEPHPATMEVLKRNIDSNNLACKVTLVEAGVSDFRGAAGITSKAATGQNALTPGNSVQIYPLDQLVAERRPEDRITVIKIDVEGGELEVVKGCMVTIEKFRPHLFIETFGDPERLLELLPEGYSIGKRYNNAPTFHFFA